MKKVIMILMVAAFALPTMAQDWQSTSTMQTSGSAYSSQVTGVGAAGVNEMATTTYSPANGPSRAKKESLLPPPPTVDENDTGNVPVGDAVLPLGLLALAYAVSLALRRKRTAE